MQVLPPLCAELRNVVIQPMILPMVLTIAESQVLISLFHFLTSIEYLNFLVSEVINNYIALIFLLIWF